MRLLGRTANRVTVEQQVQRVFVAGSLAGFEELPRRFFDAVAIFFERLRWQFREQFMHGDSRRREGRAIDADQVVAGIVEQLLKRVEDIVPLAVLHVFLRFGQPLPRLRRLPAHRCAIDGNGLPHGNARPRDEEQQCDRAGRHGSGMSLQSKRIGNSISGAGVS